MKFSPISIFLSGFYFVLVIFWFTSPLSGLKAPINISDFFIGVKDVPYSYVFAFAYGLIPIIGGVAGFASAEKWGLFKSSMGRALFFLSMGLITWGYGELIWSYYNFIAHTEIPYPSWADASFIVSWPLWAIGMLYLGKATGAKFGLKRKGGKLLALVIPVLTIIISYHLIVNIAHQGVFEVDGDLNKIFFDLAYPIFDVVVLTIAALIYGLSFKYLGGKYKFSVLITLLGFVINYIADLGFSYTTTVETFYNGNWVDLMFATAMFMLSFGITNLNVKKE